MNEIISVNEEALSSLRISDLIALKEEYLRSYEKYRHEEDFEIIKVLVIEIVKRKKNIFTV